MEKSPVFLIYVDDSSDIGNNKDYSMTPLGDGTFKATWGTSGRSSFGKKLPNVQVGLSVPIQGQEGLPRRV